MYVPRAGSCYHDCHDDNKKASDNNKLANSPSKKRKLGRGRINSQGKRNPALLAREERQFSRIIMFKREVKKVE